MDLGLDQDEGLDGFDLRGFRGRWGKNQKGPHNVPAHETVGSHCWIDEQMMVGWIDRKWMCG